MDDFKRGFQSVLDGIDLFEVGECCAFMAVLGIITGVAAVVFYTIRAFL